MHQFELLLQNQPQSDSEIMSGTQDNAGRVERAKTAADPLTNPNLHANLSDEELVRMAVAGNNSALNSLLHRHRKNLVDILRAKTSDGHLADDLAQDALLKAIKGLPAFRGDSKFSTWIYRIAINTARNHWTKMKRRPPVNDIDATESLAHNSETRLTNLATPEQALISEQLGQTITQALDDLPAALRQSVELRELEGLSYQEIAERTHCPIGTVRSRISRAREVIANRIGD